MAADNKDDAYEHGIKVLESVTERSRCQTCDHSRMYFCYSCTTFQPSLSGRLPLVRLPLAVTVIRHPKEVEGKSTGTHVGLLGAPADLRVFPDFPDLGDGAALVFPGAGARALGDAVGLRRLVFLDCTWGQTAAMRADLRLSALPRVRLSRDYPTQFWRPQKGLPDSHLATLEAIYYALVEYQSCDNGSSPSDLRPLMLIYDFFHRKIKGSPFVFHA